MVLIGAFRVTLVYILNVPITVAARSKAWVCGCSHGGIAGSNSAVGTDVCLLCVFCVVGSVAVRRADHSSRGFLPTVVCLSVI